MRKQAKKSVFMSSSDEEDLRALASIKKGNKEAFGILFNKYKPFVNQMMFRMVRDQELAKDLTMELMEKVMLSTDKYEKRFTFNSWITRVAQNYAIDYIRKKKRTVEYYKPVHLDQPVHLDRNGNEVNIELPGTEPGPMELNEEMTHEVKLAYMYKMIDSLGEKDREILNLLCRENKSYGEICEILNLKLNAVKARIKRARDFLLKVVSAEHGNAFVDRTYNMDGIMPAEENLVPNVY